METFSIEEELDGIIESGIRSRASDIHIDPSAGNLWIGFRIDGNIHTHCEMSMSIHQEMMSRIKVLARLPLDDRRLPKDGRFRWSNKQGTLTAEIRVSMMPTPYGENAVLRLFDPLISYLTLADLGFEEDHIYSIEQALALHSGIIVVAGPTGSGKTTTLYSILSFLKKRSLIVVTIEDPIERHIEGVRQIEVGSNTLLSQKTILQSVLRQNPDVIMIGEIRDKEGAELALQGALTGHLVLATIHASSAQGIRERLIKMGVSEYLISATLRLALSQRLVSRVCLSCKEKEGVFYKGSGCILCNYTGMSGRVVVSELSDNSRLIHDDAHLKAVKGIIPFREVQNLSFEHSYAKKI